MSARGTARAHGASETHGGELPKEAVKGGHTTETHHLPKVKSTADAKNTKSVCDFVFLRESCSERKV